MEEIVQTDKRTIEKQEKDIAKLQADLKSGERQLYWTLCAANSEITDQEMSYIHTRRWMCKEEAPDFVKAIPAPSGRCSCTDGEDGRIDSKECLFHDRVRRITNYITKVWQVRDGEAIEEVPAPPGDMLSEECEGKGRCHGCLDWCDVCGDVGDVCDATYCDEHLHLLDKQMMAKIDVLHVSSMNNQYKLIAGYINKHIQRADLSTDQRCTQCYNRPHLPHYSRCWVCTQREIFMLEQHSIFHNRVIP